MKRGHLSEYFTGVATKRLRTVEADVLRSHQHEFNGVEALKRIFGEATGKQRFPARFLYLDDSADEPVVADGLLTWYDARELHPTRSEHRLYFPDTAVSARAAPGDLLVIGCRPDGSALVVVARDGSTVANQVRWLFGVADLADPGFAIREDFEDERDRIALASRLILEQIGIEVAAPPDTHLEDMLRRFNGRFPATRVFSEYARSTLPDVRPVDGADVALIAWMEREEALFRTLERHLIADRLTRGFGERHMIADGVARGATVDVDGFISFSLSVQNRRKSRVGYALENHLERLFESLGIPFTRTAVTENRSRPDFLFPSSSAYADPHFDSARLTMLGVKSTCKDRWRQVLAEADRVERKHLLTLESAISTHQTDEMLARRLQLVLPRQLHSTFTTAQRACLMDVDGLVDLLRRRQTAPATGSAATGVAQMHG
jgi:hypothetical protein